MMMGAPKVLPLHSFNGKYNIYRRTLDRVGIPKKKKKKANKKLFLPTPSQKKKRKKSIHKTKQHSYIVVFAV